MTVIILTNALELKLRPLFSLMKHLMYGTIIIRIMVILNYAN